MKKTLLYNNFTIWAPTSEDDPGTLEFGRPQDWGNPDYVYRHYYFEATVGGQVYGHHCHCWTNVKDKEEWEYPSFFAVCVGHLLMPGTGPNLAGRRYLAEDDFWADTWGPRPPYLEEFNEN